MKKSIYLTVATIALILAIMSSCNDPFKGTGNSQSSNSSHTASNQEICEDLGKKNREFHDRNQKAYDELVNALKTAGRPHYLLALRNVNSTAETMCTQKNLWKMCGYMAYDKIKKTHHAEELVAALVGPPIVNPCMRGNAAVYEAAKIFQQKIQESRNLYQTDTIQILGKEASEWKSQDFMTMNFPKIEKDFTSFAISNATAVISGTIEVITIRQTISIVSKCCGHIVTKLVSTCTGAATAAVVDGPLPVGDIISFILAAGGAAWTAYDIYNVSTVMPKEFKESMRNIVLDCERTLKENVVKQAAEILKQENAAGDQLYTKVKGNFK